MKLWLHEVINRTRSDAASLLRLGTRIGLATAANDHQALRLTGLLSLAQSSLKGARFLSASFSFIKGFRVFSRSSGGLAFCFRFDLARLNHPPNGPHETGQLAAQRCGGHLRFLAAHAGQMLVALMQS